MPADKAIKAISLAEAQMDVSETADNQNDQDPGNDNGLTADLENRIESDHNSENEDRDNENNESSSPHVPLEIPDSFTGWGLCSVIGCAIFNFNTWGSNSAYSLYLQKYLNDNTFPGAEKIDYGIIGGLTFGSGLTFGPFINFCVGKVGLKQTIVIGIFIQFIGVMLASFSTKIWQIYVTQGALQGIGLAFISIPNLNIIPQWFSSGPGGKRNSALGLTAAGSGIGGIIYNIGLEPLNYRWSLRAQAIMCFGLNFVALCLIKSRNKHIKPIYNVYDRQIWTNFGFYCMVSWEMFTLFGYVVLMYNLGDFTRSLGYDSSKASIVATCVSIGIIYGRPIVGFLGDICGPVNVTISASTLVGILALAMWIPCRNFATAVAFALLQGAMMGTIWVVLASLTVNITGLRKMGVAMASSWIFIGIFGFVSPILGIVLKRDGETSPEQYQDASIFVGMCYVGAALSLVCLRGWMIAREATFLRMIGEHGGNLEKLDIDAAKLGIKVNFMDGLRSIFRFKLQKI